MPDKPVSVRIPESQIRELMGFSVLDETNLADQIRRAVDEYLSGRLGDPELETKVETARTRQSSVLDSLLHMTTS